MKWWVNVCIVYLKTPCPFINWSLFQLSAVLQPKVGIRQNSKSNTWYCLVISVFMKNKSLFTLLCVIYNARYHAPVLLPAINVGNKLKVGMGGGVLNLPPFSMLITSLPKWLHPLPRFRRLWMNKTKISLEAIDWFSIDWFNDWLAFWYM